jgi:hypothetical protein
MRKTFLPLKNYILRNCFTDYQREYQLRKKMTAVCRTSSPDALQLFAQQTKPPPHWSIIVEFQNKTQCLVLKLSLTNIFFNSDVPVVVSLILIIPLRFYK